MRVLVVVVHLGGLAFGRRAEQVRTFGGGPPAPGVGHLVFVCSASHGLALETQESGELGVVLQSQQALGISDGRIHAGSKP